MNAQLKLQPIEARALQRPAYDNTNIKHVCLWMRDNLDALKGYYDALGRAFPTDEVDGLSAFSKAQAFSAFAQCQHDRASGRF